MLSQAEHVQSVRQISPSHNTHVYIKTESASSLWGAGRGREDVQKERLGSSVREGVRKMEVKGFRIAIRFLRIIMAV